MKTLPKNLEDNLSERGVVEFVLMDFNDNDDLKQWVLANCASYLSDGYLKYFHCSALPLWNASVAKNTSHKVAQGAVLVNLDADNYTGFQGARFVLDHFKKASNDVIFWQFSKVKRDGSFGRVSVSREMFYALGGYNESFMPMGYQDNDLITRAKAMGAKLIHSKNEIFNKAIMNEKYSPEGMTYETMRDGNKKMSKENIKKGTLQANNGVFGLDEIQAMNPNGVMIGYKEIVDLEK